MFTPKATPGAKIERISLSNWLKGYQSTLDDDRKDKAGLKTAGNVVIEQNGTIRPRPSLVLYGTQPPGTVLGEVFAFVNSTSGTPVNWQACVCVVAGVANVYISQDGGVWTKCSGKNYDTSAKCHFEQIFNAVLVTNGVDNLSYLDIATSTIIPFTSLTMPVITSTTATGVGGSNFTYRYRVSAINQGETAASVAGTVGVTKVRDQWAGGTTEFVTLVWPRVTGATRYAIYVGDTTGFEYYLDTVADPGSGTNMTYVDDSSLVLNTNRLAPEGDSTAGPKVTRATNVTGQIFLVGDKDNPYRVWFGGTGNSALDFSAFDGGGWVEIDKGGKNFPSKIKGFRDGHGNPVATCFLKGTSGKGKLVHLSMSSTTLSDTIITFADVQEANGEDSTDAPDGVIYANDTLWYPSVEGFKQTGTRAQIQNILSTSDFSDQIVPDIQNLNVKNMDACVGIEFAGRLYWALPVGSDTNNQIWVLDLKRGGIWTRPWDVSADWLWLYDDSNGMTHFMALIDSQIYEFTYSVLTQDGTAPFRTEVGSGMIKFSPDGEDWGSVIDVTFVIERPQGNITFSIVGKTLDEPINTVGSSVFNPATSLTGWNEVGNYWDNPTYYWNSVISIPETFGTSREEVTIEIGQELQWLTWAVDTTDAGVDYQISDVVIRYVNVGTIGIT